MRAYNNLCVTTFSGTYRQKWNYVRNFFIASYGIDVSGNYVDIREVDDPARINAEAVYDQGFADDFSDWVIHGASATFEKWLEWKYKHGTTMVGNLPQWKKSQHTGNCFVACPYDDYASDRLGELRVRHLLGTDENGLLDTTDGEFDNPIPATLDGVTLSGSHVQDGREYYMRPDMRGGWGYACTYSGCGYEQFHGKPYFYN